MSGHLRWVILLGLIIISACGQAPTPTATPSANTPTSAAGPTTGATATASSVATATNAPQVQFDPSPAPSTTRLPAALYVLDRGQIARIERDGVTRTQLTRETSDIPGLPPIADFDVDPDGRLIYIAADLEFDRLMLLEGADTEPVQIYAETGHELSNPIWSSDRDAIYLRLLNNREPSDRPDGIYRLQLADATLELIRADDPVDDPVDPAPTINGYLPVSLNPDGTRLMVEAFSLFYDGCTPAVIELVGGALVTPQFPASISPYCGEAVWSVDGESLIMMAGPTEGPDAGPNLWQVAAADGSAAPLAATGVFARGPHPLDAQQLRFFWIEPIKDQNNVIIGAAYTMAELTGIGSAPLSLRSTFDDSLNRILWARDGSGAVVEIFPSDAPRTLRWLPADGGDPLDLPITEETIGRLRWGP
jgi:hypothetical protein